MEKVVRAFPITSREDLMKMADGVEDFTPEQRKAFFDNFNDGVEDWYYQEIAGKPRVICVAIGNNLEEGYANYAKLDDPFSLWFKEQVAKLTQVDVNKTPKGPEVEHVFCFNGGC